MSKLNIVFSFTLFFLFCTILRGTHIVGGEITYKFVSRNGSAINYHFTMKLYRDIYPKSQLNATPFDDPAFIGIYIKNANGTYSMYGNNGNRRRIDANFNSDARVATPTFPCLTPPSDIGVNEGIYEWDATLQESSTSYFVSYQRCCRNNLATNVPNSGIIGSTYAIEITPEAQKMNNSSPTFTNFPPILLCAGEPLNFDHSAKDEEGDQLVYKFCSPLSGANKDDPRPSPPRTPPPYNDIIFNRPDYTPEKPMAGDPVVAIDPNTGLITGIPNVLGNFVVSVCVEEYRNGKLLSKVSRDFQFNIVDCKRTVVTKVLADTTTITGTSKTYVIRGCENVVVNFQNNSYERSQINNFYWQFSINGDTVRYNDWSPTVVFKDTGTYVGKLLLNPDTPCGDSAFVKAVIGGKLESTFSINYDTCVAGPIGFNGTVESAFPLKDIIWDYGDGLKDSGRLSAIHRYELPGEKNVTLRLKDNVGCKRDTTLKFTWQPAPPILVVEPDNFIGCAPAKVFFNNRSKPLDSTYTIKWDFGDNTFGKEISPYHLYEKSDTYSVKLFIVSPLGCKKEASFRNWIKVKNSPKADFDFNPKIVTNLNPTMNFEDKSSPDVSSWRWYFGTKGYSTRQNPVFAFRDTGIQKVTFFVRNTEGCLDSVTKEINVEPRIVFYFPNAFTPNNDTKNDEFKGTGFLFGMKRYKLSVWNRWGEIVFQSENADEGWNGLKNNTAEQVPDGVYIYEVQYVTPQNETVVKRDFITLLR
jgi:gliding motility-associated-like protein